MAFLVSCGLFYIFFPIKSGRHMIIAVEDLIKMCPVGEMKFFAICEMLISVLRSMVSAAAMVKVILYSKRLFPVAFFTILPMYEPS